MVLILLIYDLKFPTFDHSRQGANDNNPQVRKRRIFPGLQAFRQLRQKIFIMAVPSSKPISGCQVFRTGTCFDAKAKM
jgi:hypothetical protein